MQEAVLLAQRAVPVHEVEECVDLDQQRGDSLAQLLAAHEEVAGAGLDGLRGQADVAPLGHRDHRDVLVLRAHRRQQGAALLLAVAFEVVEQHQVARLPGQALDELTRRADDLDFCALTDRRS